jgi:hypothetical protein
MKLDRKLSNAELLASGVPPEYWPAVRKNCRTPDYKPSRAPHRAEGGPFATYVTGEPIWLDDAKTGPIRVGNTYGQYNRVADAAKLGGKWHWGVVQWVNL